MKRRSFLGATVGLFAGIAAWFTKPAAAAHVPQRTTLPTVDGFNPHTDKILVVVGAVIPGYVPISSEGPVIRTSPKPQDQSSPWLEIIPNMDNPDPVIYPRANNFRLMPEVTIGTIDELVAGYRHDLERAVHHWLALDQPGPDQGPCRFRDELQRRQADYAKLVQNNCHNSDGSPSSCGVAKIKVHPAVNYGSNQIAVYDARRAELDRRQQEANEAAGK